MSAVLFPASSSNATPNGKAVVCVDHISKTYPAPFLRLKKALKRKFKPPVEAVRDVSFEVREGEIFGLIGPNGAGKTTLTKIIATLIQPTEGKVTVKGFDSVRHDVAVRRNVGLAGAEERSFYWRLSVEQNLQFFARLHGLSNGDATKRINDLLGMLQLEDSAKKRFAELSTGNKQRLSVARAMLADPPVLLLDEPTRSLDPLAAARMRATIKALAQDETRRVTVFLTSHNLAEVEELCDRVAIISKGEIKALDAPRNLRATHSDNEKVSITFVVDDAEKVEAALREAFSAHPFTLGRGDLTDSWTLSFARKANDQTLHNVLQVLHNTGCVVKGFDSERATLLEVLEHYEQPEGDVSTGSGSDRVKDPHFPRTEAEQEKSQ